MDSSYYDYYSLLSTKSSYLPKETSIKAGKNVFGPVPLLFSALFIVGFLTFWIGGAGHSSAATILSNLAGVAVVFGIAFIAAGWAEFNLVETIEDTPTSKIDGAAVGLNEIVAEFVPEKIDPLVSPLTKQKCVFYRVILERYVSGKNGGWRGVGVRRAGIPTLMTDGTGYLAIPLYEANLGIDSGNFKTFYPVNSSGMAIFDGTPEGNKLESVFATKIDLSMLGDMSRLQTAISQPMGPEELSGLGVVFAPSEGKQKLFGRLFEGNDGALAISEFILPLDKDYFVMGSVSGTIDTYGYKPVKMMLNDKKTGILAVRSESRKGVEQADKKMSFIAFGFGTVLLLAGLVYFGIR